MSDIIKTQPEVEECELPEAAEENDLALAEGLLANMLVNAWLVAQRAGAGPGQQEQHDL